MGRWVGWSNVPWWDVGSWDDCGLGTDSRFDLRKRRTDGGLGDPLGMGVSAVSVDLRAV
jgi:hypothetical protein